MGFRLAQCLIRTPGQGIATRHSKAQIEYYLRTIRAQIQTFSNDQMVVDDAERSSDDSIQGLQGAIQPIKSCTIWYAIFRQSPKVETGQ